MAGTYYLYDSIAPVADLLVSHLGFKDTDIGKLYSFYKWSCMFATPFLGLLVDYHD